VHLINTLKPLSCVKRVVMRRFALIVVLPVEIKNDVAIFARYQKTEKKKEKL